MICRLCLCELIDFVSIFNEYECRQESEVAKLIAKYFHIELNLDDAVSNKICNSCFKHLNDFHDFWLFVETKQQTLLQKLSISNSDSVASELMLKSFEEQEDVKNIPLYEPAIDTGFIGETVVETNELATGNESDDSACGDDANDDVKSSNVESAEDSNLKKKCFQKISKTGKSDKQGKFNEKTEFQCKDCNKILADDNSLRNHINRRHIPKEDQKYECNICAKKFAKKYMLDGHLLTHRKSDNYITCALCQKGFSTKRAYKAHRKIEHPEELKVICDMCGKRFKHKIGYDVHFKYAHTDLKEHEVQCQICSLWLKNGRSLERHMYNHRDESSGKEFICNVCGVVKGTKKKLTAHKNYHHPVKMQKCTICNKEFKRMLALEEHMAVHTGQPLYTCKFCPQTFKSNGNMHSHRRRLHRNECMVQNSQQRTS